MSWTTHPTKPAVSDVERRGESNRRASAYSSWAKEDGLTWLDAYEKMLDGGVLKLEEDTAEGFDWVEKLVRKLRRADELTAARSGLR